MVAVIVVNFLSALTPPTGKLFTYPIFFFPYYRHRKVRAKRAHIFNQAACNQLI